MPKISLRAYEKQLDELIEQNQLQEVIEHCRYILQSYPKCISTYRILGKTLLEAKQYTESADVFTRVLAVFPDDFISHVGMSVIQESENNLDAAIWHMELAFDSQPSNITIQEELKRLFGRRDGTHPAKIRLTRGALVRMYAKGELYPQAITEIKSALSEDPKRMDLQVLLAKMYYLLGDSSESLSLCTQLISDLPYSYELNKIMVALLPTSNSPEKYQIYIDRLKALNPYEAFVSERFPTEADVPDDSVMLDQYDGTSKDMAVTQASGWVKTMESKWEEPVEENTMGEVDWLTAEQETAPKTELPQAFAFTSTEPSAVAPVEREENPETENELPNWMREAGWLPSTEEKVDETGKAYQSMSQEPTTPQPSEEIPDWLRSLAPEGTEPLPEENTAAPLPTATGENIFSSSDQETSSSVDEDLPDWLKNFETDKESEGSEGTNIPDWMKSLDQNEPTSDAEKPTDQAKAETEIPEWMGNLDQNKPVEEIDTSPEPAEETTIPNWMNSSEPGDQIEEPEKQPESHKETPLPDWMNNVSSNEPQKETEAVQDDTSMPEWMKSIEENQPSGSEFDSSRINPNQFTRNLGPSDINLGQKESTLLPQSAPLPENWKSSIEEETQPSEKAPEAPRDQDSGIPDWVRSIIDKGPAQPEPVETEIAQGIPEETAPETPEAALSEKSGEDLLSWLRDLKPEDNLSEDTVVSETVEEPITETEPGFDFESQIDRLNDLTKKGTAELSAVTPTEETVEIPAEPTIKEPVENTPISIDQLSSFTNVPADASWNIEESANEKSEVEPVQAESIPSTSIASGSLDAVVEEINHLALKAESDPENFLLWQQLGDAYARINDFASALRSYNTAEDIILNQK